jgi:hypothetical protein
MKSHLFTLLTLLLFVSGCTNTPDMSEWAKASDELKASVTTSQRAMLAAINQTVEDLQTGKKEGWTGIDGELDVWGGGKDSFARNIAMIETSLSIMSAYANELAALSKAAEDGEEASDSLFDSMSSILTTVGAPFTGSNAALAGSKAIIDKVSEIVTRIQGQESLLDAMFAMNEAVEFMQEQIEASSKAIRILAGSSANTQRKIARLKFGPNKEKYLNSRFNRSYDELEGMYLEAINDDSDFEINAFLGVKDRLREQYLQYLKDQKAVLTWREGVKQNLAGLVASSKAWAKAHGEAIKMLKECGGIRSLRQRCGHLTVENLKASIGWVKSTAGVFKGEGGQADTPEVNE